MPTPLTLAGVTAASAATATIFKDLTPIASSTADKITSAYKARVSTVGSATRKIRRLSREQRQALYELYNFDNCSANPDSTPVWRELLRVGLIYTEKITENMDDGKCILRLHLDDRTKTALDKLQNLYYFKESGVRTRISREALAFELMSELRKN